MNVAASIAVFLGLGIYFYTQSTPAIDSKIGIEQNSQPIVNQTITIDTIQNKENPKTETDIQVATNLKDKTRIILPKKEQILLIQSTENKIITNNSIDVKNDKFETTTAIVSNTKEEIKQSEDEVEALLAKVSNAKNRIVTKKTDPNQLLAETDEVEQEKLNFKQRAIRKADEIYVAYSEKKKLKKQK